MPKRSPQDGGFPILSTYLGGSAVVSGGTAIVLTPPAGATSAFLAPEGAACYYGVNAGTATTDWPGYVPADANGFVLALDNLETLCVKQASGTVHYQWYQE
jgi:hypothetical protein